MKHDRKHSRKEDRTIPLVNSAGIPLDEAIAAVSSIGGAVYDVKLKKFDTRTVWRVKLLRGTERVKVYVDAESGQVLEANVAIEAMEPDLV